MSEMSLNLEKQVNPSSSSSASSLLALISSFQFVVTLVITRNIFDLTLPVTQMLEAKEIDIMNGIKLVHTLNSLVITTGNEIDFYHDQWYNQATSLAAKIGVWESIPRRVPRQTMKENHPATNASDYYKRVITTPVIDHLNSDLKTQFDLDSINVYNGLSIVPSKIMSLINKHIN